MRLLLVRHALAGIRGTWPGDDLDRPLDDRGTAQARRLVEQWGDAAVDAVHSSRAVRCTETVRPLAEHAGVDVVEAPQLLEGAAPAACLAWLEALPGEVVVACSHGDVIGGVLSRLEERGTDLGGDVRWPKGSTWELQVEDGLVVRGHLHEPS